MAKTHPPYPPAFRAEAAALAKTSGKGVPHLAHDLGVSEQALRGWIKRAEVDCAGSRRHPMHCVAALGGHAARR